MECASVIAVLHAASTCLSFLRDVKDYNKDRTRLEVELLSAYSLLLSLRDHVEDTRTGNEINPATHILATERGPLKLLRLALEELKHKLDAHHGVHEAGRALQWRLTKREVERLVGQISSLKHDIQMMLELDQARLSKSIKDDTLELKRSVASIKTDASASELTNMCTWLTSLDFGLIHSDLRNRRQHGSGSWFLQSDVFQSWFETPSGLLFCPGIPGAGKTMMASVTVDELFARSVAFTEFTVAYVYCDYKRREAQTSTELVGSILSQLCQERPSVGDTLTSLYQQHRRTKTKPTLQELSNCITSVARQIGKTYIIIDALDECKVVNRTLSELLHCVNQWRQEAGIQILTTARELTHLKSLFGQHTTLRIEASAQDIESFLEGQMSRLPKFVARSSTLQTQIKITIRDAAKGMFLLAELHMSSLADKLTPREMLTALEHLQTGPATLDSAYRACQERIYAQPECRRSMAWQVMRWVSCAIRPLTVDELLEALAVSIGDDDLDDMNIPDADDAIEVCAGLVRINEASNTVELAHYTVQTYLESTSTSWTRQSHETIGEACLVYMSFNSWQDFYAQSDNPTVSEASQKFRLMGYVLEYWPNHYLAAGETLRTMLINILKNPHVVRLALLKPSFTALCPLAPLRDKLTDLHVAACYGFDDLFSHLTTDGYLRALESSALSPLLSLVCYFGHAQLARKIITQSDVNINAIGSYGLAPLHYAALGGHDAIVNLLMDRSELDLNLTSHIYGQTALHWAIASNKLSVVEAILSSDDVDLTLRDQFGLTPYEFAIRKHRSANFSMMFTDFQKYIAETRFQQGSIVTCIAQSLRARGMEEIC